ncbi:MAG TPA: helix-turn-helix domain-containing protein [Ochrobactrum sp.]|nr:helix-turn-helix domain-containing protein [Ochrobactrum sp.]
MRRTPTEKYLQWIEEGLRKTGKTRSGLAAHLGVAHPQITRLLNGDRALKVDELPKIAEYLGLPLPEGDVVPVLNMLTPVVVAGTVEAGTFREVDEFSQAEMEHVLLSPDDKFPRARQVAFDVAGDSMNDLKPRPIFPGDRVIGVAYEDVAHELPLRDGMVVVVQRERDGGHFREWSVKQLELYDNKTIFAPRSTNSRHKPIVIDKNFEADNGETVEVLVIVRRIINDLPL